MNQVINELKSAQLRKKLPQVRSGDNVRVHQKIQEGGKQRIQIFEGTVISVKRKGSHTYSLTVRRLSSGVGVEKTFLLQSPTISKLEVTKRSPKKRNKLNYLRERQGKSARLAGFEHFEEGVEEVTEAAADEAAEESSAEGATEESEEPAEAKEEETPEAEADTKPETEAESKK